MTALDASWAAEVAEECDPIFAAADVGFTRQIHYAGERRDLVSALLWEANPALFAARYPDSGIIETFGAEEFRSVHCIDYWVYLDHDRQQCRISVEGWNLPELILNLSGVGDCDGAPIADVFARILAVPSPRL